MQKKRKQIEELQRENEEMSEQINLLMYMSGGLIYQIAKEDFEQYK